MTNLNNMIKENQYKQQSGIKQSDDENKIFCISSNSEIIFSSGIFNTWNGLFSNVGDIKIISEIKFLSTH